MFKQLLNKQITVKSVDDTIHTGYMESFDQNLNIKLTTESENNTKNIISIIKSDDICYIALTK